MPHSVLLRILTKLRFKLKPSVPKFGTWEHICVRTRGLEKRRKCCEVPRGQQRSSENPPGLTSDEVPKKLGSQPCSSADALTAFQRAKTVATALICHSCYRVWSTFFSRHTYKHTYIDGQAETEDWLCVLLGKIKAALCLFVGYWYRIHMWTLPNLCFNGCNNNFYFPELDCTIISLFLPTNKSQEFLCSDIQGLWVFFS